MAKPESFLAIELSLRRRIMNAYRSEVVGPILGQLNSAVQRTDLSEAHRIIGKFDMREMFEKQQGFIDTMALSAFVLGQNFFSGTVATTGFVVDGVGVPAVVKLGAQALARSVQTSGQELVRRRLSLLVERMARGEVKKAETVSTAGGAMIAEGDTVIGVGSSLMVSRLVQYGALTQASSQGALEFQVAEKNDTARCPVCDGMHGQIFDVGPALQKVELQLMVNDPLELKTMAPFPSQASTNLQILSESTREDLVELGLDTPPYHPYCRGILVPVGFVPDQEIFGF